MTKLTLVQQIQSLLAREMTQTRDQLYLDRRLSQKYEYFRKCYICLEEFRSHRELKKHTDKTIVCLWKIGQLNSAIRPVVREDELEERLKEWL